MQPTHFSILQLHPELYANLDAIGYDEMTPIQAQGLPLILANRDLIAQAKTGSGKTAAFALGILQKLDAKMFQVQAVVLCPTRELADQVAAEFRKLARALTNIKVLTLCGGAPFAPQANSLQSGAHIIVGTPGRIEDHLTRETLQLDRVTTLVLDEADRMLEMGFQESMDAIIDKTPKRRQTLLFSATFPQQIEEIAKRVMHKPERLEIDTQHDSSTIRQHFYKVDSSEQRKQALRLILLAHQPESAVIFCNTKKETQEIAQMLQQSGFSVLTLHGDLEQKDRDQALVRFANRSVAVMVATDIASRGLDVDAVDAVINFHIGHDPEIHTHRIGRTGRAGSKGVAYSLYSSKEHFKVERLGHYLGLEIIPEKLPPQSVLQNRPVVPTMTTLQIDGGKKQKLRAGDILGALTAVAEISGENVGKIQVLDNWSFVAISRNLATAALTRISNSKIKGRSYRARQL